MKKINVALNSKSIKDAIKEITAIRNVIKKTVMPEFLELCCQWIIGRANYYLEISDIGENVKQDIENHWKYTVDASSFTAKITNDARQAVFVEFGVGSVGGESPHENASNAGYEYNVNQREFWSFTVASEEDVDLRKGYLTNTDRDGNLWITTQGSTKVMYLYQALIDAKDDLRNPNGTLAQIWKATAERYIR